MVRTRRERAREDLVHIQCHAGSVFSITAEGDGKGFLAHGGCSCAEMKGDRKDLLRPADLRSPNKKCWSCVRGRCSLEMQLQGSAHSRERCTTHGSVTGQISLRRTGEQLWKSSSADFCRSIQEGDLVEKIRRMDAWKVEVF